MNKICASAILVTKNKFLHGQYWSPEFATVVTQDTASSISFLGDGGAKKNFFF
jgi:hypothetical protein